jgi:hypothetical protein
MNFLNFLNLVNSKRDSSSRLKNISNRIRTLEHDINSIQENKNKSFIEKNNNRTIEINDEINGTTIFNEFMKRYKNTKNNNITELNKSFSKVKNNKLFHKKYSKNQIKHNNIILKKKANILNLFSTNQNKNKIKKILPIKDFYQTTDINLSPNNLVNRKQKACSLFSFDSILSNLNKNNNSIITNKNSSFNKLDYEFQIIQYKKRKESLKKEKQELKKKLYEITKVNEFIEDNINYNKKNLEPLNDIISLLNNIDNLNVVSKVENGSFYENIMINIMDIKYSYEKNKLITEFLDGIKKLLKIENNNYIHYGTKINELINIKKNILSQMENNNILLKENQKYFDYFQYLLKQLNLSDLSELSDYIKNMYRKNIQETNNMEKIRVNLMKDLTLKKEKLYRKIKNFSKKRKKINKILTLSNKENKAYMNYPNFLTNKKIELGKKIDNSRIKTYFNNKINTSKLVNKKDNLYYSYNFNLDQSFDEKNKYHFSKYYVVSNSKDKKIKVNKNKNQNNINMKKQKNFVDKIKKIKINDIIKFNTNNENEKNDSLIY